MHDNCPVPNPLRINGAEIDNGNSEHVSISSSNTGMRSDCGVLWISPCLKAWEETSHSHERRLSGH